MKKSLYDLLKGKFLIHENAFKNWKFIIFISFLVLVMIASAHRADKKVHQITKLNNQVKELRSEFVDNRSKLMKVKMESKVIKKLKDRGLEPSSTPPKKIIIASQENK